jgi:signal transduction histidine kinase
MRITPVDPEPDSDGTERLAALERRVDELEREVRARDEFLSVVGHELRNPLAPVLLEVHRLIGMARNASDGVVPAAQLLPRLEAFDRRLASFVSTLNRILDVSRISAGRIDLTLETVDFAELVRDVAAGFGRELAAARSELRLTADDPVIGQWDRLRLEQICSNLVSNAIRYGAGQPIELSVRAEGDSAVLRVSDRGVGISESDQLKIFERFDRGTQPSKVGGFGVGLWIVSKLCSALGGSVTVNSRTGQGATFTVTLPRREGI